ncbi:MAG: lasso RiPP family leader peptide-containing protein [Anaerolineales bacterium]|nr:lasso RiPP family leader peptide-containing protein [Anaerolineales bacterium]
MTPTEQTPTLPVKRPYAAPALIVHGDVQALTEKAGPQIDQDGGGSFPAGVP